jgi:hypothetical protein
MSLVNVRAWLSVCAAAADGASVAAAVTPAMNAVNAKVRVTLGWVAILMQPPSNIVDVSGRCDDASIAGSGPPLATVPLPSIDTIRASSRAIPAMGGVDAA